MGFPPCQSGVCVIEKFFNKIPTIYYGGLQCLDLTRRITIEGKQKENVNLFNPLELQAGLRADHISDAYYNDAELDWMLYLANDIVDPYYEWFLDENEFQAYILDKYGSVEYAMKKVKFYRNNWPSDDTQVPVEFYNTNMANYEKQYWSPIYGAGANVIAFERKKQNWVQNTNEVVEYKISLNLSNEFQRGEIVDFYVGLEPVGTGECIEANATHLIVQSTSGNTVANTTYHKVIVGETSGAAANSEASEIRVTVISKLEAKYWDPVTLFDWEVEQNEAKKILNVVDKDIVYDLSEQVREKLREE